MIFGFQEAHIMLRPRTAIIGILEHQRKSHWVRRSLSRSRKAGGMMAGFSSPRTPIPRLILRVRLLSTRAARNCCSSHLIFDLPDRKESGGVILMSDPLNNCLQWMPRLHSCRMLHAIDAAPLRQNVRLHLYAMGISIIVWLSGTGVFGMRPSRDTRSLCFARRFSRCVPNFRRQAAGS